MDKYNKYKNSGFFSNTGTGEYVRLKQWLDSKNIENYTINDDFTVNVDNGVDLYKKLDKNLEVQFRKVDKFFTISGNPITSLKGCPKKVGTDFYCQSCPNLKTLEDGPEEVGGSYKCDTCENLISLKGSPKKVGGGFYCYFCSNLKTLEGGPGEVGGDYSCSDCKNLISLKGSPEKVGYTFYCHSCPNLDSLQGCPEEVGKNFKCYSCKRKFTTEEIEKLCKVKGSVNLLQKRLKNSVK